MRMTALTERVEFHLGPIGCELAWGADTDWWHITDGTSFGRISWASIEGTRLEMVELARAIITRKNWHSNRCAVNADDDPNVGDHIYLWSPRNSMGSVAVKRVEAERWARAFLAEPVWVPLPREDHGDEEGGLDDEG